MVTSPYMPFSILLSISHAILPVVPASANYPYFSDKEDF